MKKTNDFRIITKDGKKIAQQLWKIEMEGPYNYKEEWRDVPCETETTKSEREEVCDEIIEHIDGLEIFPGNFWIPGAKDFVKNIIIRLRDKK